MGQVFEAMMVICFGISWPMSIYKSLKSRTAKGKSIFFMALIWIGYIFGITSKLYLAKFTYVLIFYVFNLLAVTGDICLYFRNSRLDKGRQLQESV